MWLLSASRAELKYFSHPTTVSGGYAILSHTWNPEGEQSFQYVQAITKRCKRLRRNPRNHVSPKIRNCCLLAERDGYPWVWIDTCCIDKTSSTELSEAINSMFNLYLHAEVCYAHLQDVASNDNIHMANSDFRKARWHTRGWTLQELLAPGLVVLLSKDWRPIGTRDSLASLLGEITGIGEKFLTRKEYFMSTSISARMRWAAHRKTTRVEDQAYCLLGLFNLNMPTIYGEGATQAFIRFQEELAKRSFDTTLFAWNDTFRPIDNEMTAVPLDQSRGTFSNLNERFLFAPSPREFDYGGAHFYYTPRLAAGLQLQPYANHQWTDGNKRPSEGPFGRWEFPSFEVTNYGMKCRFPIAEIGEFTIAVLLCETTTDHVGLLLHPCHQEEVVDPSRSTYYIGWAFNAGHNIVRCVRLALLGNDFYNLRFRGETFRAEWRDIYIKSGAHQANKISDVLATWIPDHRPNAFRVPRSVIRYFLALNLAPQSSVAEPDPDALHLIVGFANTNARVGEAIRIHLGLCRGVYHWAIVGVADDDPELLRRHRPGQVLESDADLDHDCGKDHIEDWPGWTREFGHDEKRKVIVTFTRCPHNPQRTRVLGIELKGEAYENLKLNRDRPRREQKPTRASTPSTRSSASSSSERSRASSVSSNSDVRSSKRTEEADAPPTAAKDDTVTSRASSPLRAARISQAEHDKSESHELSRGWIAAALDTLRRLRYRASHVQGQDSLTAGDA